MTSDAVFPNAVDQDLPIPQQYKFPMEPLNEIMNRFASENFNPVILKTKKEAEDEYIESQAFKKPLKSLFASIPEAFYLTTEQIITLMDLKYSVQFKNQGIFDLSKHRESFDIAYYEVLNDCRLKNMIPITKEEALGNGFIIGKDNKQNLELYEFVEKEFIKKKVTQGKRKSKSKITKSVPEVDLLKLKAQADDKEMPGNSSDAKVVEPEKDSMDVDAKVAPVEMNDTLDPMMK